jgi:hypothetical protein
MSKSLLNAVLFWAASQSSTAADINFDQQAANNEVARRQLVEQTRRCTNESAQAMLRMGQRDGDAITMFQLQACAGPLVEFMDETLHRPRRDAINLVMKMANIELAKVLGSSSPAPEPSHPKAGATRVEADASGFTISTFKSGQKIGVRKVKPQELRNAATTLVTVFQNQTPSYSRLIDVAKGMTARDRCFNLYGSRVALASVKSGKLDSSANAEEFLANSISTIEAVNTETQVTCKMQ